MSVGEAIRRRMREPSTWAGAGFGVSLLAVFFGPEKAQLIGGMIGSGIALYEVVRKERGSNGNASP